MSSSINSNSKEPSLAPISAYKPQILKIKINYFHSWIERRLTQLLEGMEDEILWSLVFNYLEEAQKRAKKEGPAANPSGGLKAEEIQTALSGFLGQKPASNFVNELFTLLKEAEESETGIPAEFGLKPEEAVKEAFGIIEDKRREMDLSQRVRREVSHNDRYNKDRDHSREEYKEPRDHSESVPSRDRSHTRRHHSRSRSYDRHRHDLRGDYTDEHRIEYKDDRRTDHHKDDRRRHEYRDKSRESRVDRDDERGRERGHYRDRGYSRDREHGRDREHSRDRGHGRDREYSKRHSRGHRDNNDHYDRDRPTIRTRATKSPIPSSSSSSASPSPCWESSLETALPAAPRAPVAQENVPNALEQALRAKALQALANKKQAKMN